MKSNLKQLLALLLAVVIIFGTMPASVLAYDERAYVFSDTAELSAVSVLDSTEYYNSGLSSLNEYTDSFGAQLEGLAKELYDQFVKDYIDNRYNGTLDHNLNEPFVFDAKVVGGQLDTESEAYIIVKEKINKAMQQALDAFINDYPEQFWFKSGKHSWNISVKCSYSGNCTGTVSTLSFQPYEIYIGASLKIAQFDAAVESVIAYFRTQLSDDMSRKDILEYFHDYICKNTYYGNPNAMDTHTAGNFFLNNNGVVCEGYSKVFKIFCDRFGIPCVLVSGFSKSGDGSEGGHMWNYVQMEDGKWYLVDVTWDDQASRIYHTYFLANSNSEGFHYNSISQERREDGDFSSTGYKVFIYPKLSDTEYVQHIHLWNDYFTVDTPANCTQNGYKSIHCATCNVTKDKTVIYSPGHTYTSVVTASTCKDEGYTTYTCNCGYSYKGNYTEKSQHNYSGNVCTNCNYDKTQNCNCNCHKSGISGILWNILSFFYKIFRINRTCSCGIMHY